MASSPKNPEAVLWDLAEPGVFVVLAPSAAMVYVYCPASLRGPSVRLVGPTRRIPGYRWAPREADCARRAGLGGRGRRL